MSVSATTPIAARPSPPLLDAPATPGHVGGRRTLHLGPAVGLQLSRAARVRVRAVERCGVRARGGHALSLPPAPLARRPLAPHSPTRAARARPLAPPRSASWGAIWRLTRATPRAAAGLKKLIQQAGIETSVFTLDSIVRLWAKYALGRPTAPTAHRSPPT